MLERPTTTEDAAALAERRAKWEAERVEREARYDALQAEEDAAAKAEGRDPWPVRPFARRREETRRRRLAISHDLYSGVSVADVAARQGVRMRTMNKFLERWGIALPRRQGCRPLAVVYLSGERAAYLDRLAKDLGATPADAAGSILSMILAGDAREARRMLAKPLAIAKKRRKASGP